MFGSRLSPRSVAVTVGFLTALSMAGLTWIGLYTFLPEWPVWSVLVVFLITFFLSIAFTIHGVKKFIQSRIDQIHRTVHELKTGRENIADLAMGTDVLGQLNDEVQEWADEKREEIQELKMRESYRREFIGNLAHELKTPITSIQGYILTLLEGGLEDENVNRDFLERASKGVDRLTNIVEDMDTITRLEEGVLELDLQNCDLHKLVDETIGEFRLRAKKAKIKLVNTVSTETMVNCDSSRIIQVLTNLLNNSINYGKEGGQVNVNSYSVEDRVMVEVSDDGIGISAEHLPRLFERFYRVGSSRSRHEGGSGLGLAIVKHIIEAHGQAITVVSVPNGGTRFSFSLKKA